MKNAMKLALEKVRAAQQCHPNAVMQLLCEADEALEEALAKQEQGEQMHPEIKQLFEKFFDKHFEETKREWVGLTDDERNLISTSHAYVDMIIRAAEAKLKEKNT